MKRGGSRIRAIALRGLLVAVSTVAGALAAPSTSRLSNRILGMSCAAVSLCVASDSSGNAIYGLLIGVDGASCPSTTLCVAVDGGGFVVTSSSASFCAAVDRGGQVVIDTRAS